MSYNPIRSALGEIKATQDFKTKVVASLNCKMSKNRIDAGNNTEMRPLLWNKKIIPVAAGCVLVVAVAVVAALNINHMNQNYTKDTGMANTYSSENSNNIRITANQSAVSDNQTGNESSKSASTESVNTKASSPTPPSSVPSSTASVSKKPVSSTVSSSTPIPPIQVGSSNFQEILGVDFNTVDKVVIFDGTTGKHYDIVGKKNVVEFLNLFKDAKLTKSDDQKQYTGFIFSVGLYKSNHELTGFNFGYDIITVWKDNNFIRYNSSKNFDNTQIEEIVKKYKLE